MRVVHLVVTAGVLAGLAGALTASTAPGEPFFVGFAEDLPKEIGRGAVTPAADLAAPSGRRLTPRSHPTNRRRIR